MQRAELARINAEAEVERTGRLVETSRFSLSRRIGAPVAGPLDEDWFASVASHSGPLEPIDSADTLALAEAEANVAVPSSEEARVGKEVIRTCGSRRWPYHSKKNTKQIMYRRR